MPNLWRLPFLLSVNLRKKLISVQVASKGLRVLLLHFLLRQWSSLKHGWRAGPTSTTPSPPPPPLWSLLCPLDRGSGKMENGGRGGRREREKGRGRGGTYHALAGIFSIRLWFAWSPILIVSDQCRVTHPLGRNAPAGASGEGRSRVKMKIVLLNPLFEKNPLHLRICLPHRVPHLDGAIHSLHWSVTLAEDKQSMKRWKRSISAKQWLLRICINRSRMPGHRGQTYTNM